MLTDPIEDSWETEFLALYGAFDEGVSGLGFDGKIISVTLQKNTGGRKRNTLIAVEESVVIAERLHQRGCFFFEGVVVSRLRTKNGGLDGSLISNAVETAEHFDQPMLYPVDFRNSKVVRHLSGKTLQKIVILGRELFELFHHFGAHQVLGRNHVA
jgi:hypothetical protein